MANNKRIFATWETGKILYALVERESDGFLLDSNDGTFSASPVSNINSLTADVSQGNFYKLDENRTSWSLGNYNVNIYLQTGGTPVVTNDILINSGVFIVRDDGASVPVTLDKGHYIGSPTHFAVWNSSNKSVTVTNNIITGMVIDNTLELTTNDTTVDIVRGDTPTLTITLGRDLSGETVTFFVKKNINDSDGSALVNRAMTISDTVNGIVTITLTVGENAQVGNMWAEVNLTNGGVVLTAAQFRLNIIERVKD